MTADLDTLTARALDILRQLPRLSLPVALQMAKLEAEAGAALDPDPTGAQAAREESEYSHSDDAHQEYIR